MLHSLSRVHGDREVDVPKRVSYSGDIIGTAVSPESSLGAIRSE